MKATRLYSLNRHVLCKKIQGGSVFVFFLIFWIRGKPSGRNVIMEIGLSIDNELVAAYVCFVSWISFAFFITGTKTFFVRSWVRFRRSSLMLTWDPFKFWRSFQTLSLSERHMKQAIRGLGRPLLHFLKQCTPQNVKDSTSDKTISSLAMRASRCFSSSI